MILTVFYFTIALPFGLGARWLSDPLRLKQRSPRAEWKVRPQHGTDLGDLRQQS